MQRDRIVLLVAMIVFAVSFLLPAVYMSGVHPTFEGYWCAYVTIVGPWTKVNLEDISAEPIQYFSILLSGLINPLFLASIFLLHRERTKRIGRIMRLALLCLLPVCWIVFLENHLYPHVGYFLWVGGMILALYSSAFSARGVVSDGGRPLDAPASC